MRPTASTASRTAPSYLALASTRARSVISSVLAVRVRSHQAAVAIRSSSRIGAGASVASGGGVTLVVASPPAGSAVGSRSPRGLALAFARSSVQRSL